MVDAPAPRGAVNSSYALSGIPNNLPVTLDSFIGRREEMVHLLGLLEASRSVTLTGSPGVGKTRLALEVARSAGDRFGDGVWFVDLAPVADSRLVPQALASTLSLPERASQPLMDTLVSELKNRRALLVMDNCEHVLASSAGVVDILVRSCPEVFVLATSQERLSITGEAVFPVPPMPVPGPASDPNLGELLSYDAVRLFGERALAALPTFELLSDVAGAVQEICRRLDGIPLAIELAAGTVSVMSPHEIAAHLDDRFRVLTRGSRSVLPRHQTLLNALEWSYGLLGTEQQWLLARLSVFAGGATLEAVQAVCGEEAGPGDVFAVLASLVDKSLVLADTTTTPSRYRLLETVRFFARDRLADLGDTDEVRANHARWFLDQVEKAEPGFSGHEQEVWLERVDLHYANVRTALEWAISEGDADLGQRLAGALTLYWRVRGYFSEGQSWLAAVLALDEETAPSVKAKALWGLGFLDVMLEHHDEGRCALAESIELFTEVGDESGCARSLLIIGNSYVFVTPDEALPMLSRSVELSRRSRDNWCLSHSLAMLGIGYSRRNQIAEAQAVLEESIAVARAAGDTQGLRIGLILLGQVVLSEGDLVRGEKLLEEALALLRQLAEPYGIATSLLYLGELALVSGQWDRAADHLEESLAIARTSGNYRALSGAWGGLGRLAFARGDLAKARRWFEETEKGARTPADVPVDAIFGLGEIARCEGDVAEARSRFELGLSTSREHGYNPAVAMGLYHLGNLAMLEGDATSAASMHHEALELRVTTRQRPGIARSLAALAALATRAGRHDEAARLFGAAEAIRETGGYALRPDEKERLDADVEALKALFPPEEFEPAWAQGKSLSIEEAVTYASRGRGARTRSTSGWDSLTNAERNVASLVAEGLSNADIAARLFVSPRTVTTHLSRIFSKLAITSRTELAVEVVARQNT